MPYKDPELKRKQSREWQAKFRRENPVLAKETRQKWYAKNKAKVRAYTLMYNHGLTLAEYESLYNYQDGCCAICDTHIDNLIVGLAIDHDHRTGYIRGLLCLQCNTGLGNFKDDPNLLDRAKEYLK